MTQPSEDQLKKSLEDLLESRGVATNKFLLTDHIIDICRPHFSPTPPIDYAFKDLEKQLREQPLQASPKACANAIRQQAEEIAELKRMDDITMTAFNKAVDERDELQSQLDAIKGQAVVAKVIKGDFGSHLKFMVQTPLPVGMVLIAFPPAENETKGEGA